jgi:hypothetical protein
MSETTADIIGTKGANFSFKISAAQIVRAVLDVPNQASVPLVIDGSRREVTIPSLPAGDSGVRLGLVWAPGESDALVDLATVTSGTVRAAAQKGILSAGDLTGLVELFGTEV